MNKEFEESGMTFSFPEENVFLIEKARLIEKAEGFSACECVALLNEEDVAFIEAKNSIPKSADAKEQVDIFVDKIQRKFADTLTVFHAILLRHNAEEVPERLQEPKVTSLNYKLFLIVNGAEHQQCAMLCNVLRNKLRGLRKVWRIEDRWIKVVNDRMARDMGLIVDSNGAKE